MQTLVASSALKKPSFSGEDGGLVSLSVEKDEADGKGSGNDSCEPKGPPPPQSVRYDTADERTEDRRNKRGHAHDGHGTSSLFLPEHVANDARVQGSRGYSHAQHEAKCNQHIDVLALGGDDRENDERRVCGVVNPTSPVDL